MEKRYLNEEELKLLIIILTKNTPDLLLDINRLNNHELDNETINKMREAVGDELIKKGFDKDWKPNDYGNKLETLIDTLSHYWK